MRKGLIKQANGIKVTGAEFKPQEDKRGRSMADVYGQRIMNRASMFVSRVITNNAHAVMPPFSMNRDVELSREEQAVYGTTLSEQVCCRKSGSSVRRMQHDAKVAKKEFEQVQVDQQVIQKQIEALEERARIVVDNHDYEGAYILQAEIRAKSEEAKKILASKAQLLKQDISAVSHGELQENAGKTLLSQITSLRTTQKFVDKKMENYRVAAQRNYEKMVQEWANEEFVQLNSEQFKKFGAELAKKCPSLDMKDEQVQRGVIAAFVHSVVTTDNADEKSRIAYQAQVDMLLVKNNIEEAVVAQVYCEHEDFKKDFEKYRKSHPEIKSDEEAKVWFYSTRKREDAVEVGKFKKANQDKVDERTMQLAESKKLRKHEKKKLGIVKGKGQETTDTQTAGASPAPAPAPEVGRTA